MVAEACNTVDGAAAAKDARAQAMKSELAELIQDQSWVFGFLETLEKLAQNKDLPIEFRETYTHIQSVAVQELRKCTPGSISIAQLLGALETGLAALISDQVR